MRPTEPRWTAFAPVFALLGLLTLAGAAAAQPEIPAPERTPETGLDQRIDIALQEADVSQVLASFGEIVGGEAEVDPEIRGEVAMELHHVRAATVLTAVCESVGCRWWIEDGRLRIEKDPGAPPVPKAAPGRAQGESAARLDTAIDMELVKADLRETLKAFGTIVRARVVLDDAIQGTVSVDLHNTPAREALDAICRTKGCAWELEETDEGPVLRFTRR